MFEMHVSAGTLRIKIFKKIEKKWFTSFWRNQNFVNEKNKGQYAPMVLAT